MNVRASYSPSAALATVNCRLLDSTFQLKACKSLITPELTVAAVIEADQRFLLVEERVGGRAVLNQPAGHVEPGESVVAAMQREAREETAWQVEAEALLGLYYWPVTPRGDCVLRCAFAAHALSHDARQPLDDGIITTHWLTRAQIIEQQHKLRSPLVLRAIDAWLAGTRLPLSTIEYLPGTA